MLKIILPPLIIVGYNYIVSFLGLHKLGVSALHVAVRANAVSLVRKLLKYHAEPNHVQLFSETPLHTGQVSSKMI